MPADLPLSRKQLIASMAAGLAAAAMPARAAGQAALPQGVKTPASDDVTLADLQAAERMAGISFSDAERKEVLDAVRAYRAAYDAVRKAPIRETTGVPLAFVPAERAAPGPVRVKAAASRTRSLARPTLDEDVAFLPIHQLGQLLRAKKITSVELTRIYLGRLKQYGDALLCLVSLTEDLALHQAEDADNDFRAGIDRGPLHGIPYGAKDLLATKGIPTTWGADPYKAQVFDYDAAVIERLRAAGAVLVAKLSMGSLAMGDVWFKGTTKNPWNLKQGSSGSSAGSAAATAAGLIAFGIGTETSGSILSPSIRCRVTGLRPTFGRVSRFGAMELCYSLDRIGPLCREAEDCALVLSALCGADPRDPSSVDRSFEYPERVDLHTVKIGWVGAASSMDADVAVKRLRDLGATVTAIRPAPFPQALSTILSVESASAFDAFTRTDAIHGLQNSEWPKTFRGARFVPAVEYIQAQRLRTLMMRQFEQDFGDLDAFLGPGIGGPAFSQANYHGYPAIALPFGDDGNGNSVARTLIGRPYQEGRLVAIAKATQDGFDFHRRRPDLTALIHN
jgi:Asp-tRNA(Asn)/Glu-tRNA(Gln) amidotransferase A subunit family amidase